MDRQLLLLLLLGLLLPSALHGAISVTCETTGCVMATDEAWFVITNEGARMFINDNGTPRTDLSSLMLGFGVLTERAKVSYNGNVSFCSAKATDPWQNVSSSGDPYGELFSLYNLTAMTQTYVSLTDFPYPGVHTVQSTINLGPNSTYIIYYSVSDSDFEVVLSNDTDHTVGVTATSTYKYVPLEFVFLVKSAKQVLCGTPGPGRNIRGAAQI